MTHNAETANSSVGRFKYFFQLSRFVVGSSTHHGYQPDESMLTQALLYLHWEPHARGFSRRCHNFLLVM
jgi:hypothetical protein